MDLARITSGRVGQPNLSRGLTWTIEENNEHNQLLLEYLLQNLNDNSRCDRECVSICPLHGLPAECKRD